MIKGHTEIQLYKDGKMVQNTHDDNMLTNALANYFKNYGQINPNAFGDDIRNDFITTLLGGVLLLDTALPEQASLTHVPGGVLMVGNGAYGVSNGSTPGDPTEMGSFNASQSGWADNNKTQFRMVWDFTTEQSNGTIACACLTSRAHGFMGEGNATSKVRRTNSSYTITTYEQQMSAPSNHVRFYADASEYVYSVGGISNDHEINIYRQRKSFSSVDLRSTFDASDSDPFRTFTVSSNAPAVGELSYAGSDASNLYLYEWEDGVFTIVTIPKTLNTASARVIPFSDIPMPSHPREYVWRVDGNYLYGFNDAYGARFDLTTLAKTEMIYDSSLPYIRHITDDGGKIRFSCGIYDKTLNRMLAINADGNVGGTRGSNFEHPYKDSLYIDCDNNDAWYAPASGRRNDYIATINNLSTPVTKDNTQTMKVIYTLTFTG